MAADPLPVPEHHAQAIANEQGLARQLSERQLGMIAIGGAIGTGLFLGSALSVRTAGPGVILSYIFVSGIALLLMYCLSEMAVAHPTAGSFGVYADLYLSPWAGFVVRYTYWAAESIAAGGEAVAAAIYTRWWFPNTPVWAWVIFYSALLIYVNAHSVGAFGSFEYWFSTIKVSAIVVFILMGGSILLGIHQQRPIGLENFHANGGFLPRGWTGVWLATAFVIFSFIGTEIVAVTAGEAKDPQRSVPRALRTMLLRLVIFYVGAITILVGVIPWTRDRARAKHHRQPLCARLRVNARADCRRHPQLRGLDRGAFRHELLPLFVHANGLLAGTRRLCSAGFGTPLRKGRAHSGAAGVGRRPGPGNAVRHRVPALGLCLHVWNCAVRRAVRVADDLRHPSQFSPALGREESLASENAVVPIQHDSGRSGGAGDYYLDVVG